MPYPFYLKQSQQDSASFRFERAIKLTERMKISRWEDQSSRIIAARHKLVSNILNENNPGLVNKYQEWLAEEIMMLVLAQGEAFLELEEASSSSTRPENKSVVSLFSTQDALALKELVLEYYSAQSTTTCTSLTQQCNNALAFQKDSYLSHDDLKIFFTSKENQTCYASAYKIYCQLNQEIIQQKWSAIEALREYCKQLSVYKYYLQKNYGDYLQEISFRAKAGRLSQAGFIDILADHLKIQIRIVDPTEMEMPTSESEAMPVTSLEDDVIEEQIPLEVPKLLYQSQGIYPETLTLYFAEGQFWRPASNRPKAEGCLATSCFGFWKVLGQVTGMNPTEDELTYHPPSP